MTLKPEQSPDRLSPTSSYKGRRLNRLPLVLAAGVMLLMIGLIGYTYMTKMPKQQQQASNAQGSDDVTPEPASADAITQHAPLRGEIKNSLSTSSTLPSTMPEVAPISPATSPQQDSIASQALQMQAQEQLKFEQAREEAEFAAMNASASVQLPSEQQHQLGENGRPMPSVATAALPSVLPAPQGEETNDPNKQKQKAAWLNQQANTDDYLHDTRKPALSPYEIKAGSVIPATMIGGVNSDLPGTITAQVSQNVYDTATGQYLLIPQGSRLVGVYDNGVSMGQKRVLVAWNRVIYPDGSSLDLAMMPGTDQGGYAGFKDLVDNHYVQVFGNALMMSLFSAGIQLSQPQSNDDDDYSSSQIIAASIGQQMGELGMAMAQRGLNIAPTLEIRPGYPFNVMVTKDIILKTWEGN